jgi:N-acetylneuraminate synthase
MINRNIFEDLFVLEMANNHQGSLDRGLCIVRDFGRVARYNNVRAAIKLQLRDADTFVHPEFKDRGDIRYIKKTMTTQLDVEDFMALVDEIQNYNCLPMATPFDEKSVDLCMDLGVEIIKIASSDINDWILIERIARTRKPVIASTGGSSLKDMDDLVTYFDNRRIPLALNHCVSIYPSEDSELELNQIDFLCRRYPNLTIGFSTHEHTDWQSSIMIAYAKGARMFERHVDVNSEEITPYCSTPEQIDVWFKAWHKAQEMCGAPGTHKRNPPEKEVRYLDGLVRGIYAAHDLAAGHELAREDLMLCIPLQRGQLSCRELIIGERLAQPVNGGRPITLEHLDNLYASSSSLRSLFEGRGL